MQKHCFLSHIKHYRLPTEFIVYTSYTIIQNVSYNQQTCLALKPSFKTIVDRIYFINYSAKLQYKQSFLPPPPLFSMESKSACLCNDMSLQNHGNQTLQRIFYSSELHDLFAIKLSYEKHCFSQRIAFTFQ